MEQSPQKKRVRFAIEKLNLICEWENCTIVENNIDIFLRHIINEHLTRLNPGDLHCHWKDCEGFTDNLSEFKRHILLHAFHSKLKCYGENLQVRRKLPNCSLNIHSRNIVPELPDPLICCWEDCTMEYDCPEYFYRHVGGHADYDSQKDKSFYCFWQGCNRTFSDTHKVKDHLRSHTQEKVIACPTCGGMFASRTKFLDHIQRQQVINDGKTDLYICEYCPKKMNSERLLRDHMRLHVNHYKCPFCDMTCPTPSGIASHISYRHSKEKPHSCQYCDYRCKSESDLRKHLESHSMVPTYKCSIENCKYESRSQTCFSVHYRKTHEGKLPLKYSCHLCEKVFSRGTYLSKHLLNHHKFRWPSGHCRFRYCLNEEGVYRLQTVRYESVELSEVMMRKNPDIMVENEEDIDNPSIENMSSTINDVTNSNINSYNISEEHSQLPLSVSNASIAMSEFQEQHIINSSNITIIDPHISSNDKNLNLPVTQVSSISNSSGVFNIEEGNNSEHSEALPVMYVPCIDSKGQTISEEPVLIKILEVDEITANSFTCQNTNAMISELNQPQSVSCLTGNSKGALVFSTIKIVEGN